VSPDGLRLVSLGEALHEIEEGERDE